MNSMMFIYFGLVSVHTSVRTQAIQTLLPGRVGTRQSRRPHYLPKIHLPKIPLLKQPLLH